MISRTEYESLRKRIEEAWGSDITPAIQRSLEDGSYRLIDNMTANVLDTLPPVTIKKMIDEGKVAELRAIAERLEPRYKLIAEVLLIYRKHAA
jgi:hypothetical protein